MLSRVANNLIWLDRYMERGYGILNLLKANFYANQDSPKLFSWAPIINNYNIDQSTFSSEDPIECIQYMIFDSNNSNSIVNVVSKARENARSVQEHISREMWISINNYYHYLMNGNLQKKLLEEDLLEFLDNLMGFHLRHYGTVDITEARGPSYYFLNVGRYLERVILISEFTALKLIEISKTSDSLEQSFYWKNLLLSIGGYRHYLKTHKSTFEQEHIITMIFQDEFFPRSVYYCINKLKLHIDNLIRIDELKKNNLEFLLGKLESSIKYTTIESINNQGLDNFIKEIKEAVKDISLNVNTVYFSQVN